MLLIFYLQTLRATVVLLLAEKLLVEMLATALLAGRSLIPMVMPLVLVVPPPVETLSADMVGITVRVAAVILELSAPPTEAAFSMATVNIIRMVATLVAVGPPHPRLVLLGLPVAPHPPALVPVPDQPRVSCSMEYEYVGID